MWMPKVLMCRIGREKTHGRPNFRGDSLMPVASRPVMHDLEERCAGEPSAPREEALERVEAWAGIQRSVASIDLRAPIVLRRGVGRARSGSAGLRA